MKIKHILPIIILFVIHINCSLTQWSVGFDFKVFSLKRVNARWGMSVLGPFHAPPWQGSVSCLCHA